jgi:hypothetical protein
LFTSTNCVSKKIRREAEMRKLVTPNAEIACLILDMLSIDEIKDMGLSWITIFHKPIKNYNGTLCLLYASRLDDNGWLCASCGNSSDTWQSRTGFAFEYSRKQIV